MPITFTEQDFEDKPAFTFTEQDFLDEPSVKPKLPIPEIPKTFGERVSTVAEPVLDFLEQNIVWPLAHPIKQTEKGIGAVASMIAGRPLEILPQFRPSVALETPIATIPQIPQQKGLPAQVGAGMVNAVTDFANFFLTPEGVATLGIGGLPKAAQKQIVTAFGAQMAASAPGQLTDAVNSARSGDWQQAAKQATAGVGGTILSAKMVEHGTAKPQIRITPTPEQLRAPAAPEIPLDKTTPEPTVPAVEPAKPVTKPVPETEAELRQQMAEDAGEAPKLETVPEISEPKIKSYGEKYVEELGIDKARERIDHLNKRTEEEFNKKPVDRGAIRRLQEEAQNIANAIDKPIEAPAATPEPAPMAEAAKLAETIKPALLVNEKPVAGEIGDTHETIQNKIKASDPEDAKGQMSAAIEAFADDGNHVFVDESGKLLNREEAAEKFDKLMGNKPGTTKRLHSQDLKKLLAPEAPKPAETAKAVEHPSEYQAGYKSGSSGLENKPAGISEDSWRQMQQDSLRKAHTGINAEEPKVRDYWKGWLDGYNKSNPPVSAKPIAKYAGKQYGKDVWEVPGGRGPSHVSEKTARERGFEPEPVPAEPKPTATAEPAPVAPEPRSRQALGIASPGTAIAQKAIGSLNRTRQAFGTMFRAGSNRKLMDQTFDATDNKAVVAGQQAGTSLRIGSKKLDREAAMAIVESGRDKEKLGKFLLQSNKNPEAKAAVQHAMKDWDRLKPLADRTQAQLDSQIQQEKSAGINTEFREDYVPHIYDMDLMMGEGRPFIISGKGGGVATGFKKGRTFDTVFDAIEAGYSPKSLDVADLVEHRVKVGQRLINRKQWAEGLRSVPDPTDGNPIVTGLERRQRGPGGEWYEVAPMGYTPREILPGVRIAVHEGYAPLFDALTGNSRVAASVLGRILLNVAGGIKHGLLAFDTFHASRIAQRELFLTGKVSYKKGQTLLEYSDSDLGRAVKEDLITQEIADWVKTNRENANLLLDAGLNVGKVQEDLYSGIIRNIRGIGTFNKWVFEKLTRGAMLESGLIEMERVQAARPDLSPEQVARQVSRDLNAYFGNIGRQGVFKSQTMQDMARLVMLAPNWVEGMARTEIKGAWQGAKGLTYDPVVHKALLTGSIGKGMAQGLLAYFLATQLINLATRKKFTWQNDEEGHKLDAWIPQIGTEGGGYFLSPFSVQAEITHDMLRYGKTEPSTLDAAARVMMNKSSPYWRAGKILLQGKDWDRKQVTDNWDRAKKAAFALAPTPIPLSPLTRSGSPPGALQRQLTASAGLKTEPAGTALQQIGHKASQFMEEQGLKPKGIEIQFTDDPSYQNMRQAIRSGDKKDAQRIIEELEKTKPLRQIIEAQRQYADRPFTGSEEHERQFLRSLSDADRDLYWQAREQRKEELKKFYQMLP